MLHRPTRKPSADQRTGSNRRHWRVGCHQVKTRQRQSTACAPAVGLWGSARNKQFLYENGWPPWCRHSRSNHSALYPSAYTHMERRLVGLQRLERHWLRPPDCQSQLTLPGPSHWRSHKQHWGEMVGVQVRFQMPVWHCNACHLLPSYIDECMWRCNNGQPQPRRPSVRVSWYVGWHSLDFIVNVRSQFSVNKTVITFF